MSGRNEKGTKKDQAITTERFSVFNFPALINLTAKKKKGGPPRKRPKHVHPKINQRNGCVHQTHIFNQRNGYSRDSPKSTVFARDCY